MILLSCALFTQLVVPTHSPSSAYQEFCRRLETAAEISGRMNITKISYDGATQVGVQYDCYNWIYLPRHARRIAQIRDSGLHAEEVANGTDRASWNPPKFFSFDSGRAAERLLPLEDGYPFGFEAFFVLSAEKRLWYESAAERLIDGGVRIRASLRLKDVHYTHPIKEDEVDIDFDVKTHLPVAFVYRSYDASEKENPLRCEMRGTYSSVQILEKAVTPKIFFDRRIAELRQKFKEISS